LKRNVTVQFEEGNSCCRNVTNLGKYFGCFSFSINRQQLYLPLSRGLTVCRSCLLKKLASGSKSCPTCRNQFKTRPITNFR